ncbi:MAG: DUF1348 family protein [Proteobacteria bacterium]|nr:DUF1348 family protein [Pseudomonadota bacterium]
MRRRSQIAQVPLLHHTGIEMCRWRPDSIGKFLKGRDEIISFLQRKWQRDIDYRPIK